MVKSEIKLCTAISKYIFIVLHFSTKAICVGMPTGHSLVLIARQHE